MLCAGVRCRALRRALHRTLRTRMHSSIANDSSSSGHVIVKPASDDEHPLVHPLVLAVEPATLQAATLIYATRDASADRCPPAATLQALVGGWSGRQSNRGPSARLLSLPSQPHHLLGPSHSRPPPATRTRVPPVSAHVGYITVQAPQALLMRQIAVDWWNSLGEIVEAGMFGRRPTHDRHTQDSHQHMRGTRSRNPRTRSRIARTRSRITRTRSRITWTRSRTNVFTRHARANRVDVPVTHPDPQVHHTESRSESGPGSSPAQKVHNPLVGNHAPSGWLLDRGVGLQTHSWH